MRNNLKNMFSASGGKSDDQELLKYLQGEMDDAGRNRLERELANDDFERDALDGLQEVENAEKIALIVNGLNRDLKKRAAKKAAGRAKTQLKPQWWLYFSVLILLLIFAMIYLFLHSAMRS